VAVLTLNLMKVNLMLKRDEDWNDMLKNRGQQLGTHQPKCDLHLLMDQLRQLQQHFLPTEKPEYYSSDGNFHKNFP